MAIYEANTQKKKGKEVDRFIEALMPESDERVYKFSVVSIILALICSALFTTVVIVPKVFLPKEKAEVMATLDFSDKDTKEDKKK